MEPLEFSDDIILLDGTTASRKLILRVLLIAKTMAAPYSTDKARDFFENVIQYSRNIREGQENPVKFAPSFKGWLDLLDWKKDNLEEIGRILENCRKSGPMSDFGYPAQMVVLGVEELFKQDCDVMVALAQQITEEQGLGKLRNIMNFYPKAGDKKRYPLLASQANLFIDFLDEYMSYEDGSFARYYELAS